MQCGRRGVSRRGALHSRQVAALREGDQGDAGKRKGHGAELERGDAFPEDHGGDGQDEHGARLIQDRGGRKKS